MYFQTNVVVFVIFLPELKRCQLMNENRLKNNIFHIIFTLVVFSFCVQLHVDYQRIKFYDIF